MLILPSSNKVIQVTVIAIVIAIVIVIVYVIVTVIVISRCSTCLPLSWWRGGAGRSVGFVTGLCSSRLGKYSFQNTILSAKRLDLTLNSGLSAAYIAGLQDCKEAILSKSCQGLGCY